MEERGAGGLPYVRALDGLRGVAVALVVAFHGGVPGAGGGFLGVSLFFTLSGYLITQLLLNEHADRGRISLRAFWGRRLRRLAPASLLTLLVVGLLATATTAFPGPAVPGDVAAAALDVANWRFLTTGSSYEDLFTAGPSPVLHFWSLAIEEQLYLVLPLLVAAVLHRTGRRGLAAVLAVLAALGTLAAVTAPTDIAYYGTHTRAPELLAGALLAMALPIGAHLSHRRAAVLGTGGAIAALAVGALVATTALDSGWLHAGGLPAFAVLSVGLIAATATPGPVRWVASWAPLVATGRLSYGIYLYHWPLFLLLDERRVGLDGPALFAVRVAATSAMALASARLLENPIRHGARLRSPRPTLAALATAMAVVLLLTATATPPPAPDVVPDVEQVAFRPDDQEPELEVLVVGSVPEVVDWVREAAPPDIDLRVQGAIRAGCPLHVPDRDDGPCVSFARMATPPVPAAPPDLIVVGLGTAERHEIGQALRDMAPGSPVEAEATLAALEGSERILSTLLGSLPLAPVLFVDTTPGDTVTRQLHALALRSRRVHASVATDAAGLRADLATAIGPSPTRRRVLVLGDSTSFQLATAIDAAAGGDMEVLWAGRQNCPLLVTTRIRWSATAEFDQSGCPSAKSGWPEAVADLRPDLVVAAASLPELSEQQYPGVPGWARPGDAAYVARHDAAMQDLQELVAEAGAVTLVATIPPVARGRAFDGPVGEPERREAWHAQLARWDAAWHSVGVLDWGSIASEAEHRSLEELRIDAVHFTRQAVVDVLAGPLLRAVERGAAQVESEARRSGCLLGEGSRRLVLAACAVRPSDG